MFGRVRSDRGPSGVWSVAERTGRLDLARGVCGVALALCSFAVIGAGLVAPSRASAQQEDGREAPPEALQFYQRGRDLYQNGNYREAVLELERALMLDPGSPNLIYNVARVHELLGNLDRALLYYRQYLTVLPEHEQQERQRTTATIRRLEGALRNQALSQPNEASQLAPDTGPRDLRDPNAPFVVRSHGVSDTLFWTFTVSSAVLLGAALVTGLLAIERTNAAGDFILQIPSDRDTRQQIVDEANALATTTDVLMVLGVGAGLTAILLYALREQDELVSPARRTSSTSGPRLCASLGPGGASLSLTGPL